MSVVIVTDSTSYVPEDICREQGIEKVSLYVNRGERSDKEADIVDLGEFYRELKVADELPTTSQPSVGDFIETYKPLLERGDEIVSIHISAGISGTCESAQKAKSQLEQDGTAKEGQIHVIDSKSTGGGLGIIVIAASSAAPNGASSEEVVKHVVDARESLKMWITVDTLEFLKRGGRIGTASAWIGTTLKIKPILSMDSELSPVERVRTSKRAFERLVDFAKQRKESGASAWVVQHIQAPEEVERLVDSIREIMGSDPVFVSEVGPVIGAHIGPGLLGFGSIDPDLLSPE